MEWTLKDSVLWAMHENGVYVSKKKMMMLHEITAAVSPTGDSRYLRKYVRKAIDELVAEGSVAAEMFYIDDEGYEVGIENPLIGERFYAISSELTEGWKSLVKEYLAGCH